MATTENFDAQRKFFSAIERQRSSFAPSAFAQVAQGVVPNQDPVVPKDPQSVFESGNTGLVSIMVAEQQMPDEAQKELASQRQHLINLSGVASAYVRQQAAAKKDNNLVYNTDIWQEVYNNLPLMGPSKFSTHTFNKRMLGMEMANNFITTIMGAVVSQGAALADFTKFLSGLGDSIRAGYNSGSQSYTVGMITIVLESQGLGNSTVVNSYLKGYFVDFSQSQKEIASSCGSAQSINVSFNYRYGVSLFNAGALADPKVAESFASFISGTQVDDVQRAKNFFSAKFDLQKA